MTLPDWKAYQEEAAAFFRSLGLTAETDVTLKGVRTHHDVDVLVVSRHAGFDVRWVVECKHWKAPVSKLHVLALREIVADLGVDRGILLSESGFQRGAREAAELTNVRVTSLALARAQSEHDIAAMRLTELWDRNEKCMRRRDAIPKQVAIETGLRPDLGGGYSGRRVVEAMREVMGAGLRGAYPFEVSYMSQAMPGLPPHIESPLVLVNIVDRFLTELEAKLTESEAIMHAASADGQDS